MKPTSTRPVSAWLDDETGFRALAARVDRLVELQSALREHFAQAPLTVVSLDADTLTLRAPNAAWAARLRQSTPTMLQALRARFAGIDRIRIVTQRAGEASRTPAHAPRAAIPSAALRELDRLRSGTDAPALGDALTRLVRRHRNTR
ncbi:MAG: DciA family protein [Burkholderiaceae bacterium]|nr:DciA family protein [Burkholderiaceae bacterium]